MNNEVAQISQGLKPDSADYKMSELKLRPPKEEEKPRRNPRPTLRKRRSEWGSQDGKEKKQISRCEDSARDDMLGRVPIPQSGFLEKGRRARGHALRYRRLGDFAGGAGDFFEESAQFDGIFFAGAGFYTAGHVDGIRTDDADSFGYIFGSESAGEDDALSLRGGASEVPIAGGAAAAVLAGSRGIEEECRSATKAGKFERGGSLPQAQGFDDGQAAGDGVDDLRGFIAVELRGGEAQGFAESDDRGLRPVDEDADRSDEGRKPAKYFRRGEGSDAARAAFIEIQTYGVGAEIGAEFGVFPFGDTTDFEADHEGQCSGIGSELTVCSFEVWRRETQEVIWRGTAFRVYGSRAAVWRF